MKFTVVSLLLNLQVSVTLNKFLNVFASRRFSRELQVVDFIFYFQLFPHFLIALGAVYIHINLKLNSMVVGHSG